MDPRLNIIDKRLMNIGRLIAISGGKGGIGKSSVASVLALTLAKAGYRVGLMDLDFTSPSTHIILGIKDVYPEEEFGVIPPEIHGIKFMSIIYYAGDNPSPLRGVDISNAMIELLAITRWGSLDFLIIDMPPGIGDATLDVIRLMKRTEFLIITTGSRLALETAGKVSRMLRELKVPIIGVIENMKRNGRNAAANPIMDLSGEIGFDEDLEGSMGDVNKLLNTDFARDIKRSIRSMIDKAI